MTNVQTLEILVPTDADLRTKNQTTSGAMVSIFVRTFEYCIWWSAMMFLDKNFASFIPNAVKRLTLEFTRSIAFLRYMED